jgi:flagellar protein FliS
MLVSFSYSDRIAAQNPAAFYRRNNILTATPEQLVVMAYDGLLRFLSQAKAALDRDETEAMTASLGRARDIVAELMASLEPGYEISKNLQPLYGYMFRNLMTAGPRRDREGIEAVESLAKGLRDAWAEAAEKCAAERRREAAGLAVERV